MRFAKVIGGSGAECRRRAVAEGDRIAADEVPERGGVAEAVTHVAGTKTADDVGTALALHGAREDLARFHETGRRAGADVHIRGRVAAAREREHGRDDVVDMNPV